MRPPRPASRPTGPAAERVDHTAWCRPSPRRRQSPINHLNLDREVERWVVEHRVGWLDWLFIGLSRIGSSGLVWIAIGLVLALRSRRPEIAVIVAGAALVGLLEASLLKAIVGRARPHDDPLVALPHTHSFPSGHAASSFAAATVLARLEPRFRAWFFLLAAAIAASRVYLGVHWPSDVLAGALLGTVTALLLLAVVRRARRRAPPAG